MHSDDLRHQHSSPNIITAIKIRKTRWAGEYSTQGRMRNTYVTIVRELEDSTWGGGVRTYNVSTKLKSNLNSKVYVVG